MLRGSYDQTSLQNTQERSLSDIRLIRSILCDQSWIVEPDQITLLHVKMSENFLKILDFFVSGVKNVDPCVKMSENGCQKILMIKSILKCLRKIRNLRISDIIVFLPNLFPTFLLVTNNFTGTTYKPDEPRSLTEIFGPVRGSEYRSEILIKDLWDWTSFGDNGLLALETFGNVRSRSEFEVVIWGYLRSNNLFPRSTEISKVKPRWQALSLIIQSRPI